MAMATATRTGKKNVFRLAKQQLCTCIMLFLYISLLLLHHHNVKVPKFMFCQEHEHKTTTLFFFSSTLIQSFYRIQLHKNLMNWMSWNKCNKVWSSMNSLFKWRFHSRRSRCCLSSLIVIVAKVIWKNANRTKWTQSHRSDNFFLVIHFAFLILIIIKVVYLLYIMKFIGLLL